VFHFQIKIVNCRSAAGKMRFLNSLTKLFIISVCILFVSSCYPKGKKSKVSFLILIIYFLSLSFSCQVEIGSDTYVCIFITPLAYSNTTSKYIRIAATLTADSLSRIRIPQGSLFGFSLLLVYWPYLFLSFQLGLLHSFLMIM
jgi:uncharacterized membrane protein YesL